MTKVEMVSIRKQYSLFNDPTKDIDGSDLFEDKVNKALREIDDDPVDAGVIDVKYSFAVEKNDYIYTAMIVYEV